MRLVEEQATKKQDSSNMANLVEYFLSFILFSPFAAWFPGGATILQALLFVFLHGSRISLSLRKLYVTTLPHEPCPNLPISQK
jgi:hypothetical protein